MSVKWFTKLDFINGVFSPEYLKSKRDNDTYREEVKSLRDEKKDRTSLVFFSKAAKFSAVGASGLAVNYLVAFLFSSGAIANFWYVKATLIGIIFSMTSNFLLNKIWTFGDRNFSLRHVLVQYIMFLATCSAGAVLQLVLIYGLVQSGIQFEISLITAVLIASGSNFVFNKIWTFHEKIWS
jgi:dolichol-phosphate mannosyltransferase